MEFNKDDIIGYKLRMSIDLRMELGQIAKKNNMSLNSLINMVLKEYVGRVKK